jgi:mono/diheme cytochrome c family protein
MAETVSKWRRIWTTKSSDGLIALSPGNGRDNETEERQLRIDRFQAAAFAALAALTVSVPANGATEGGKRSEQLRRGEYLVTFGGCHDCHSPKVMSPQGPVPDPSRLLSGHPQDETVPPVPAGALTPGGWMAMTNGHLTAWVGPWGVSYAANLTPDKRTGLGGWTGDQFVKTMRTGKHLGVGRPLLPPMPVADVAALTDADLRALFAWLQSIKPIENQVPQPSPPK